MVEEAAAQGEPFYVTDPQDPTPGTLGVLVRESRMQELRELEQDRRLRVWCVRGVVSDRIPQEWLVTGRRRKKEGRERQPLGLAAFRPLPSPLSTYF